MAQEAKVVSAPWGELPRDLDRPEIRGLLAEFEAHRIKKRSRMTTVAWARQIKRLAAWGAERAILALQHSLAQGYQGIFEPSGNGNGRALAHDPIAGAWNQPEPDDDWDPVEDCIRLLELREVRPLRGNEPSNLAAYLFAWDLPDRPDTVERLRGWRTHLAGGVKDGQ